MLKEHIRRLTVKGQVTVPANVRKKLGVEPGDRIIFRQVTRVEPPLPGTRGG